MNNRNKNITILLGGWNNEAEVSRKSGEAVYDVLMKLGYQNVAKLEFDQNVLSNLKDLETDIVFNALHGQFGEDGKIQGLLDIAKIKYTHSGLLSSAICMNKVFFKSLCQNYNILMAESSILKRGNNVINQKIINKIGKPFVIKPIDEGSSVGVEVIFENDNFEIEKYNWKYGEEVIIEQYISGQELNVAILGQKALGIIEVIPKESLFYDYKSKYTSGMTDYVVPNFSDKKNQEIMDLALRCHNIVGCSDLSRVEFIYSDTSQKLYLLEINTHPGITSLSLVPKIAKNAGLSFEYIVEYLINNADYNK